jgi:hypothetical protein
VGHQDDPPTAGGEPVEQAVAGDVGEDVGVHEAARPAGRRDGEGRRPGRQEGIRGAGGPQAVELAAAPAPGQPPDSRERGERAHATNVSRCSPN